MLVARATSAWPTRGCQTGFVAVNQLAGPPVGAALFAVGDGAAVRHPGACASALGVVLITRVRLPAHGARGRSRAGCGDDILEGWSWLWAHAAVRTLAITIFTFNVTFGAAWSVLVLYAARAAGPGRDRLRPDRHGHSAWAGCSGTVAYGWLERPVGWRPSCAAG